MTKTVVIRDLEFNYPALAKPKSPFGTEQWEVQVATTNKDTIKELEAAGLKLRESDGKKVCNIKRKTVTAKGDKMSPPKVLDKDKQEMAYDAIAKIGNGSKGAIKVFTYDWSVGGRSGKSAMLTEVMITDYKEYAGNSDEEEF